MLFEWDDFGANHVISDQCQSHDCRDQLLKLKELNPKFKATLFAIPAEMTPELLKWASDNSDWIELAMHGFFHTSNYECEKMTYEEFDDIFDSLSVDNGEVLSHFVRVFRAPGWQISDDIYKWLLHNKWYVADQNYNTPRRPIELPAYVYDDQTKEYLLWKDGEGVQKVDAYHGHTWDVGWNGIYEDFDKVVELVENCGEFKFVSELFK